MNAKGISPQDVTEGMRLVMRPTYAPYSGAPVSHPIMRVTFEAGRTYITYARPDGEILTIGQPNWLPVQIEA